MSAVSYELKLLQLAVRSWPFRRGQQRLQNLLQSRVTSWPDRADFSFRYGRFVDVSLAPWPRGYRDLFVRGVMEENELRVWQALLRSGDCVIDGGANLGYWSLAASHFVGSGGRVFAFEPVPTTAAALRRNIAASGRTNVVVEQAALVEAHRTVTLHTATDDVSGSLSSIVRHGWCTWNATLECPGVRLDEFCSSRNLMPKLIKLDLEGAELAALRGAEELFRRAERPVVAFEWNPVTARAAAYDPEDVLDHLITRGYRGYLPDATRLRPFRRLESQSDWFPTVWCFADGEMRERAIAAHLIDDST